MWMYNSIEASLEFAIPSLLVQQTLDIARLQKIR